MLLTKYFHLPFFGVHEVLYLPTFFEVRPGCITYFVKSKRHRYVSLLAGSLKSHMHLNTSCSTGVLILMDTYVEREPLSIMDPKGLWWVGPTSFYKVCIIVVPAHWDFRIVGFCNPSWLMSEPSTYLNFLMNMYWGILSTILSCWG